MSECPRTRFPDGTLCGDYGWHGIGCPARADSLATDAPEASR